MIKPVLDCFDLASVSTIRFLSSCTVFSMSCYSVGRELLDKTSRFDYKTAPLAAGAAAGGVLGQSLFRSMQTLLAAL